METNQFLPGLLLILFLGLPSSGLYGTLNPAGGFSGYAQGASQQRASVRAIYTAEIGVREASGRNDGSRVEAYLRYCGLGKGYSWCAAFVCWVLGQAKVENPENPWAPALFPARNVIWKQGKTTKVQSEDSKPKQGAVFGLYYPSLKRIAHCGFVDVWDDQWVTTVEGNTDNGVFRKRRPVSTLYAIAVWN